MRRRRQQRIQGVGRNEVCSDTQKEEEEEEEEAVPKMAAAAAASL